MHPDQPYALPNQYNLLATNNEDSPPGPPLSQEILTPTALTNSSVTAMAARANPATCPAAQNTPKMDHRSGNLAEVNPAHTGGGLPDVHTDITLRDSDDSLYKTLRIDQPDVTRLLLQ